jgi:hypothetical protein
MKKIISSEHDEQVAFVEWLEINQYKFSAIPNATWTSFSQAKKNTAEGVRPGLPDLLVIVNDHLVWIEMKRSDLKPKRGGMGGVSPVQREWHDVLNRCANCQVFVCYGYDEAVAAVRTLASSPKMC